MLSLDATTILTQGGAEIPLSFAPRIICAYYVCEGNHHAHGNLRIIGHSTLGGRLMLPETYELQGLAHLPLKELHLWNTGDHFEPIFNMHANWEQHQVYQALFLNPTASMPDIPIINSSWQGFSNSNRNCLWCGKEPNSDCGFCKHLS